MVGRAQLDVKSRLQLTCLRYYLGSTCLSSLTKDMKGKDFNASKEKIIKQNDKTQKEKTTTRNQKTTRKKLKK